MNKSKFISALDYKFETFQNKNYHDKRKHSVLEANMEKHKLFSQTLKENRAIKARTDPFKKRNEKGFKIPW